jgi:hypothetical protein
MKPEGSKVKICVDILEVIVCKGRILLFLNQIYRWFEAICETALSSETGPIRYCFMERTKPRIENLVTLSLEISTPQSRELFRVFLQPPLMCVRFSTFKQLNVKLFTWGSVYWWHCARNTLSVRVFVKYSTGTVLLNIVPVLHSS